MSPSNRLAAAFEKFDAVHQEDPNKETFEGKELPKELVYSLRMSRWLERLAPDASEPLRLAARCQHIGRWQIPRDSYPMTKAGYKQWRTDQAECHAEKAGTILREIGYEEATIACVQSFLRKEHLKDDPEMQLLEDVICIVFLENYFEEFAGEHEEEKLLTVLRKTWRKMSPRGQEIALKLDLPARTRELVEKALSG